MTLLVSVGRDWQITQSGCWSLKKDFDVLMLKQVTISIYLRLCVSNLKLFLT